MFTHAHKHILVAPLDWGLGHTARCVPIIAHLLARGHKPVVACNTWQRAFIEKTFGAIDTIDLPGYNITYSRWNEYAQAGLLAQLPRMLRTIKQEHQWLQALVKERQIDGIISDNRYGLYHDTIPSVMMTHQLQVRTGMGNIADKPVRKMHYRYLQRFGATWVVDAPGTPNLGGELSHPDVLPANAVYIGLLSRFAGNDTATPDNHTLLILLSGPEPLRTELSKLLWAQAAKLRRKIIFVEGTTRAPSPGNIPAHISYHKQPAGDELLPLLQQAGIVVCRSGYSTLMDLAALGKTAIVIPTPGQTEQLYLGKYLHDKKVFYCAPQKGFDLDAALTAANNFPLQRLPLGDSYGLYKGVVDAWVRGL